MMFTEGIKNDDPTISIAFWALLKEVTHNDVATELKHLVVNTEVGLCRAWIRLALNDGLLVSYITAILANNAQLKRFYGPNAFLMDSELPYILKEMLQGLMHFEFRLNYNSSKLNTWETRTLELAGVLQSVNKPGEKGGSLNAYIRNPPSMTDRTYSITDTMEYGSNSTFHSLHCSAGPLDGITEKLKSNTIGRKLSASTEAVSERIKSISRSLVKPEQSVSPDRSEPSHQRLSSERSFVKKDKRAVESIPNSHNSQDNSVESSLSLSDSSPSYDEDFDNDKNSPLLNQNTSSLEPVSQQSPTIGASADASSDAANNQPKNTFVSNHEESITRKGKNVTVYKINIGNNDRTSEESKTVNQTLGNSEKVHSHAPTPSEVKSSHSVSYDEPFPNEVLDKNPNIETNSKSSSQIVTTNIETNDHDHAAFTRSISNITVVPENNESVTELIGEVEPETPIGGQFATIGNRLNAIGWSGWSSAFDNTNDVNNDDELELSASESPTSSADHDEMNESFGSLLQIYGNPPNYTPDDGLKFEPDVITEERDVASPDKSHCSSSSSQDLTQMNFEVVPMNTQLQGQNVDKKTLSSLKQLTEIATEKGLDKQSFCCHHCGVLIGLIYGPYRVCRYDGAYYCYDCHDDEEHIIPARVIQDWDFRKYKVSKYNKLFLMKIEEEPLFHIDELNSLLYDVTPELSEMKTLRIQLQHIKEYIQTCREEIAEDFRRRLWPREYLCDDVHQYSLLDLLQVYNGQQAHHLKKVITQFSKHIYKCTLCCQKGFICEYCSDETIIYPFQVTIAVQCPGCLTTFHRSCRQDKRCPKCVRIRLRMQSKEKSDGSNKLYVTQKESVTSNDVL